MLRSKSRNFLETAPLHPFLFGIYPALALWLANIQQIPAFAAIRPLVISLGLAAGVYAACRLIARSWIRASFLASVTLLFLLLYGHVFNGIANLSAGGFIIGRHRYLFPLWFAALAAIWFLTLRARRPSRAVNTLLNSISLFLVVLAGGQIVFALLRQPAVNANPPQVAAPAPEMTPGDGRDVYYILLDTYARADYLASAAGVDNSDFIRALEKRGFIVDPCAQVNYDQTPFSLVSSLNLGYLEELGVPFHPEATEEAFGEMAPWIKNSRIRSEFEALGYQFITFKTQYPWLDIADSDIYFDAEASTASINRQESFAFQYLFFQTTVLRPLTDALVQNTERVRQLPSFFVQLVNPENDLFRSREYRQYLQNEYAFDTFLTIAGMPGQKFVYAHLFPNHLPFVYNPDGSFRATGTETLEDYAATFAYTNRRVLEMVDTILERSTVPPVIILQGDHNYATTAERVKILNALYLPEGGADLAYQGMTPVNTFRLVLDYYFGQANGFLPDRSFHSPLGRPYQFEEVPGSCASR